MARPMAKFLIGFGISALVLVAAGLMFALRSSSTGVAQYPAPNGYDLIAKAGSQLSGAPGDSGDLNEPDLRAFVSSNAESLALMRRGFSNQCRTRLDYSGTNTAYIQSLSSIKGLAMTVAAEGKLAELEKRPADAGRAYSDAIRLGCEFSRGGRIIESLVAIAVESIGTTRLRKLTPALEPAECRELASSLEISDGLRERPDAVLQAEREWARRAYGIKGEFVAILTWQLQKKSRQAWLSKLHTQQLQTRLLMLDLAARAYESDKGQRPRSVNDLVPTYLKSIPLDPITGTNIVYRL